MYIWRLAICPGIHNHAYACTLESEQEERETASDRPSMQPKVRPTDSPSSLTETQNKYCVDCYDIYSIHSLYKASHKKSGAAEGRATSSVIPFVLGSNKVNMPAITTILVLHVGDARKRFQFSKPCIRTVVSGITIVRTYIIF